MYPLMYSLLLVRYLNFAAQSPLAKSWYSWHQKLAKIIYSRPSVLFPDSKKKNLHSPRLRAVSQVTTGGRTKANKLYFCALMQT